ncbi:MAG: C-terminal helicase domain-containing protein, partial [Ginsengibacter sp.]
IEQLPAVKHAELIPEEYRWILDITKYKKSCKDELLIYQQISDLSNQLSGRREKEKVKTIISTVKLHNKILAFDSTIITLEYFKKLLDDEKTKATIIVATGQNEKNKNIVKKQFSLDEKNSDSVIALCSDAMAEGINLTNAKALILLDMPSVLRIIEQRIGRLERMDSEHKEIHVYWPNDSDAFSLKGDKRMVDILIMTSDIIGNNVGIPKTIYEKYFKEGYSTEKFMKAYKEFSNEDGGWEGVQDSTQALYSLIEGKDKLIDRKTYNEYIDINASVKTAISFVESERNFSFFAFRGDVSRSPKWLFIDERNKPFTDFHEITTKLKEYLSGDKII